MDKAKAILKHLFKYVNTQGAERKNIICRLSQWPYASNQLGFDPDQLSKYRRQDIDGPLGDRIVQTTKMEAGASVALVSGISVADFLHNGGAACVLVTPFTQ
jgi:hypothetical protein